MTHTGWLSDLLARAYPPARLPEAATLAMYAPPPRGAYRRTPQMDADFLAAVQHKSNGSLGPPPSEPEIFPVELVKQAASSIEAMCAELRTGSASVRAKLDSIDASIALLEQQDQEHRQTQERFAREATDAVARLNMLADGIAKVVLQVPQTRLVQSNGGAA